MLALDKSTNTNALFARISLSPANLINKMSAKEEKSESFTKFNSSGVQISARIYLRKFKKLARI